MNRIATEVAIVGGGIMGAVTALYLRRRKVSVAVLERGSAGMQASGVNFGNLRLQARKPPELPLSLRAQNLWADLEAETGESFEYFNGGHLWVARNAEQMAVVEAWLASVRGLGVASRLMSGRELRSRWPWLSELAHGAAHGTLDATVNPRLATPAVVRAARAAGAVVREGAEVVHVGRDGAGFRLATRDGLEVRADILVNAAGAWALAIAESFGEPVPMFTGGPPELVTEGIAYFIEPVVQTVYDTVIFRQVRRGSILVAGHPRGPVEEAAQQVTVAPEKMARNLARLVAMVPDLAHVRVVRTWSGIEGYFPDMMPVIAPSRTTPGLFHAFGFSGRGYQMAPGVGAVLAELIADGRSSTPIDMFGIGRFDQTMRPDIGHLGREFDARAIAAGRARIAATARPRQAGGGSGT